MKKKIVYFLRMIKKTHRVLRDEGMNSLTEKINNRIQLRRMMRDEISKTMKKAWKRRHDFWIDPLSFGVLGETLEEQRKIIFSRNIKFSIIVPLYNTPKNFLMEMIASVLNQTYSNWELCLADGSDKDHGYVEDICRRIAEEERRIKYKKLERNGGISENSNAALEMATGDWISLFDHDDLLHPCALFETAKAINETGAEFVYTDEAVFESPNLHAIKGTNFKPDFAPDYFLTNNYICHFSSFKKELLDKTGKFDKSIDGAQDYDLFLKIFEHTDKIVHVPKCLYYWRSSPSSSASGNEAKPYTTIAGKRALENHFSRCQIDATVSTINVPNIYRISYPIPDPCPMVTIIIPNCDHHEDLEVCIKSILERSTYTNFEIIIVENNSAQKDTFSYYESLADDSRIRIVNYNDEFGKQPFNYSRINNYGVKFASGNYILFLNNDTEVKTPDWIEQMLMFCIRKDVGIVGAKLYYPDGTIQHGGVVIGLDGIAGHSFSKAQGHSNGYVGRLIVPQNLSAVTGACLMIRRNVFDQVDGLFEGLAVAFNDVDLCMKVGKLGLLIVWTPYAELFHYESKSRGRDDTPKNQARFTQEINIFKERWGKELEIGDPYYNRNLSLNNSSFLLIKRGALFPYQN